MIGRILTGDQFISDQAKKEYLVKTCYTNRVPFVILRAISDSASDEAIVQYSEFVKEAAEKAIALLSAILE